ncbi:MAG TPA: DNA gyrase subunit A [Stellaceae bacterium]|nr:DNA gyrase subunit A [Stellaceae bacterium]
MAVTSAPPSPPDISTVTIEEEMRRSYLDYAMSVIVARALPDVRDGLKPVHRRILYSMQTNGNLWNRGYRKSARIVGDVIGKYHPHGELAIYDAMVRMAQDFAMRLKLIDGQGNFGSMDGDPPAAYRYTEARLARAADSLLDDLDKNTVDFQDNYDGTEQEPKVLPAGFPNLLVNGAQGIAVGMATNIPTHNLGEVIDACCAYLDNPAVTVEELMEHVPAPDFPTGGIILGRSGTHAAYRTGRGAVVIRARHHIEEIRKDRDAIVFTEIPYQVNKAKLVERIAETVREKLIDGIAELRDESDREGLRIVVELKRDAEPEIVLNQLFRFTALQTSFGVNMLALNGGRPELLTLRDVIGAFVAFREEVVTRRTTYLLGKARERAHILAGLLIAVANIDEIIALIRAAPDPATAREGLMARRWPAADVAPLIALVEEPGGVAEDGTYRLSDAQARAILDLRLQRLTGLERSKIAEELQGLISEIGGYLEILRSRARLIEVVRGELLAIKEQFSTPRRTAIEEIEFEADIEALIQREDMVVTVSHAGYIKRVPLSTYRAQRRGGRGRAGMAIREEDFVSEVFVASTHAPVLFFTSSGRVYKLKVHRLPLGTPQARGRPMVNLLPNLTQGETISTVMPLPEDEESWAELTVMFATAKGHVRRNALSDFGDVRANGKIAMKFEGEDADDRLIAVATCTDANDVLLATRNGKSIRFPVGDVRVFSGRSSVGVRGIRLLGDDAVISMSILRHEEVAPDVRNAYLSLARDRRRQMGDESEAAEPQPVPEPEDEGENGGAVAAVSEEVYADLAAREECLLSVTEKGFGVRSSAYDYRITGRGGQGINNMDLSRRGDAVVAVFPVGQKDQVMLVTDGGMVIRCPVHDIRIARRGSQGVVIFKVGEGERVVSVARLPEVAEENGDDALEENGAQEADEGEEGTST